MAQIWEQSNMCTIFMIFPCFEGIFIILVGFTYLIRVRRYIAPFLKISITWRPYGLNLGVI